jgi:GTP-binding protein EngB required for normal cell division
MKHSFQITLTRYLSGEAPQAGPALVITDMPGFGFAYMNPDDLLRCNEISKNYLTRRGSNLKRVLLLLDARHGLKVGDEQFFRELFATTSSGLGKTTEVRKFSLHQSLTAVNN